MNINYINNSEEIEQNNLYENEIDINNPSINKDDNEKDEEQEYENEFNENNNMENENNINNENNSSTDSKGKNPIYVMSLQLDDGKIAKIKIYSDSDPNEVAQTFCLKNNFEPQTAEYLKNQIEALINQFNNEENINNENENENEMGE